MNQIKMTKAQFKEAFKRGLGSSLMELRGSPAREKYKDIVLWSCLRNTCYDMQSEGGRGIFLYEAIGLFEDRDFFEQAIIQRFMRKNLDTGLFNQLCELLYSFSMDGSMKARYTLYEKYRILLGTLSQRTTRKQKNNLEWLCIWLTSLDEFSAFKSIVTQLGERILENSESVQVDWFYANSKNKFGDKRVDKYLQKNAVKSEQINAFLMAVSPSETPNKEGIPAPTLENLIQTARENPIRSRMLSLRYAKVATDTDLVKLAKRAIEESDLTTKLGLLWTFKKVRFPLGEQIVFDLTESDDRSIRDIAFEMLQLLPSERTNSFAINLITQKKELANALSLLCACYKPESESILVEGLQGLTVSYEDNGWHGVFMKIEDLLDNRSVRIDPSVFFYMYRQTLCSFCRNSLIQKMAKRKILPREILEECSYDSYEDTRAFALRKLKKRASK